MTEEASGKDLAIHPGPDPGPGDEVMASGLNSPPDGLVKRETMVQLKYPEGTSVVVTRWSTTAVALVADYVAGVFHDMPPEMRIKVVSEDGEQVEEKEESASNLSIALAIASKLGKRLNNVIALSVRPEDRKKVAQTDGDDLVPLLLAILEVNESVILGLKKGVPPLLKIFGRVLGAKSKSTP